MEKLRPWIGPAVVSLILLILGAVTQGLFSQPDPGQVILILCNVFFIAGVFTAGIGALTWISRKGGFDMIRYGLKTFFSLFSNKLREEREKSYHDYIKARKEEKWTWKWQFAAVGGALIVISLILMAFVRTPAA